MKCFTTAITTLLFASTSLVATTSNAASMSPYMEQALIQTCKAAATNKTMYLKQTLKEFRLNTKTVALGVVCNGENIIEFAENRGANKTAAHMNKKIGKTEITDIKIAQSEKYSVTFPVSPK